MISNTYSNFYQVNNEILYSYFRDLYNYISNDLKIYCYRSVIIIQLLQSLGYVCYCYCKVLVLLALFIPVSRISKIASYFKF